MATVERPTVRLKEVLRMSPEERRLKCAPFLSMRSGQGARFSDAWAIGKEFWEKIDVEAYTRAERESWR